MGVQKTITIKEYDVLVSEQAPSFIHGERISKKSFDELSQLIDESKVQDDNDHGIIFRQLGHTLHARHYVGIIQTSDGTKIEILPKLLDSYKPEELRRIFLKMLRLVGELPYKSGKTADLSISKFPLLEIFIHNFLISIDQIVKRGIRSDYIRQEDNQAFIKGKLLMSQQFRHNLVRRDRFYVEYDNFEINRPENRLIKTSLQKVLKLTKQFNNQRLARELLFTFDDVSDSTDYIQDFQKCNKDRGMHYYQDALGWCKLILNDLSPVPNAGERSFRSFLFPMPALFERYVEKVFIKNSNTDYLIKAQLKEKYLANNPINNSNVFQLKPDLAIYEKNPLNNDKKLLSILDTKWKLIDQNAKYDNGNEDKKAGISQADMYQMFAYGNKYLNGEGCLILIYPKSDKFNKPFEFTLGTDLILKVFPFDLDYADVSAIEIFKLITKSS